MANTLISYLNKRLTRTAPPGKEIKQPGPVITISRQVGCSGLELAYALADILNKTSSMEGWKVISKEILNHSARELDLEPGRIARIFKQQDRSAIDEIISAFSEKKFKSDKKIKKTVIEVIRNFAEDGFCIIVGRGSNIIAADIPNSLHIRLEAPMEDRLISIMNKNGWNREESIRFIERVEKERYAYRHAVMQELNQEEDHFDITFNRSRLNTTVIAGLIMEAIREKKILAGYSQKIEFF